MIVGTAGHVDHGKTALVRALTGVDTDRLAEEKRRGVSIELGFAYLPAGEGPPLGFVDVPGHERFVHTMVAGAAGIDFALVVVAADDGVMPQTREHLAILDLLQVRRGLFALTKADLASPERLAEVRAEIREATRGGGLDGADIFAVSSLTGQGVDALRDRLLSVQAIEPPRPRGRFRLAVDRVFSLNGVGVVVTGPVLSGAVRIGDRVALSPSGLTARVRSLHAQNRTVEGGEAGVRCAINLAGDGVSTDAIRRGDMVLDPFLHAPTDRIDARLTLLAGEPRPLRQGAAVRLHHGAAELGARVVLLQDGLLLPGRSADVQLVLDRPIAASVPDRFVLRDGSGQRTLGGGAFVDLRPPARHRRTAERSAQRAAQARPDPVEAFAGLLAVPPFAWDLTAFARDRALGASETERLIGAIRPVLLSAGDAEVALAAERWDGLRTTLLDTLATFHTEHPDRQGMAREILRRTLEPVLPPEAFAAALLRADLVDEVRREGAVVRLAAHVPRLGPEDEALWPVVAALLGGDARFRPPRVRDMTGDLARPEAEVRRLLKLAGGLGRVDQVAHDHFFLRSTVAEMAAIAADVAAAAPDGSFTAAEFRDRLLNGRKVAIQILEFFDREGLTTPRQDRRRINPGGVELYVGQAVAEGPPPPKEIISA